MLWVKGGEHGTFRKTIRTPKEKNSFTGAACRAIRRVQTSYIKVGVWCFPNKKILRNSPCLPACKQKNIATRLRDTT